MRVRGLLPVYVIILLMTILRSSVSVAGDFSKTKFNARQMFMQFSQVVTDLTHKTYKPMATPPPQEPTYTEIGKALMDDFFLNNKVEVGETSCSTVDGVGDFLTFLFAPHQGAMANVKSMCITRTSKYKFTANIRLTTTPYTELIEKSGQYVNVDIWQHNFLEDSELYGLDMLKGISAERDITVNVSIDDEKIKMGIVGFGINANGSRLFKDKSVPDSLLHFGIRGAELKNNGDFSFKISAPIFAIPASYNANVDSVADGTVRILGFIKFKLNPSSGLPKKILTLTAAQRRNLL